MKSSILDKPVAAPHGRGRNLRTVAISKKICLIGAPGVGKTSLVRRYVHSLFSERYLTTVGVCIEKKVVTNPVGDVGLVIWDLAGDDELQRLHSSYLRGTAAYLLVADGTRPETVDAAVELQARVAASIGDSVPFLLAINKADLVEEWRLTDAELATPVGRGWDIVRTSAKEGSAVELVFRQLAQLSLLSLRT